jgi:hypothetical protein
MPQVRSLLVAFSAIAITLASGATAKAQAPEHGRVEFAILPSMNLLSWDDGDESATAFTFPTVSPGIRMTFWTRTSLTFDFGLSFGHMAMEGDNDPTALALEFGPGIDFAPKKGNWHPFASVLVGYLSIGEDEAESEAYVGGTVGVRHFVRDYAATRLQIGYRRTLGDFFEAGNLEIAAGVSFFL